MNVELTPQEIKLISEALAVSHRSIATMFVDGARKSIDHVENRKAEFKALRMKIDSLVLQNAIDGKL